MRPLGVGLSLLGELYLQVKCDTHTLSGIALGFRGLLANCSLGVPSYYCVPPPGVTPPTPQENSKDANIVLPITHLACWVIHSYHSLCRKVLLQQNSSW